MKKRALFILMLALIVPAYAQQTPSAPMLPTPNTTAPNPAVPASVVCPAQVQGAFNATKLICEGLGDGQVCLGNGIVEGSPREGASVAFSQPADRTDLVNLNSLNLQTLNTPNALWAVVLARNILAVRGGVSVPVTMIAFGDVTITDDADVEQPVSASQRTGQVIADFGLIVRRAPDAGSAVAYQLRSGEEIVVTGVTADKTWLRIQIPTIYAATGWVYAPYVSVDTTGLATVDVNSPVPTAIPQSIVEFRTMQAFRVQSAETDPGCAATPDSGVLLQTPDGLASRARTRINGAVIDFNGTLFVQTTPGTMLVTILEGEASLEAGGNRSEAVVGQTVSISISDTLLATGAPIPDAAVAADFVALPYNLLPRPIGGLDGTALVSQPSPDPAVEPTQESTSQDVPVATPDAVVTPESVVVSPTPAPVISGSLQSSTGGEVCTGSDLVLTESAAPIGVTTDIGGVWRAAAGTTATFTVEGSTFQPNYGTYIRLNSVAGIVAQSGDQPTLTVTFDRDVSFSAFFSSKSGDVLTVTVRCGG